MAAAPARTRLHIPLDLPPPPPSAVAVEEHTALLRELLLTMQRMCALLETQAAVQQALIRDRNHRRGRYRGQHRARPRLAYRAAMVSLLPVLAALSFVAAWASG